MSLLAELCAACSRRAPVAQDGKLCLLRLGAAHQITGAGLVITILPGTHQNCFTHEPRAALLQRLQLFPLDSG